MTIVAFGLSYDAGAVVFASFTPEKDAMATVAGEIAYVQRFPTDPIGSTTVEFSGINANSEIRVYFPDATEAAGVESCAVDHALSWSVFSAGSANNTVRIVIIHPDYKIKEFEYVSSVGNQSIPVQQERDKWYQNPI